MMLREALVEIGTDLQGALDLVSKTFDRANPDLGSGSLSISNYNTQSAMRNLVFDERQREFLFEGKRYFDLLRRIQFTIFLKQISIHHIGRLPIFPTDSTH